MEDKEYCKEHDRICESKEAHERRLSDMEYSAKSLTKDVEQLKTTLEGLRNLSTEFQVFKTEIKTMMWVWGGFITLGCSMGGLFIGVAGVVIGYLRFVKG